MKILADVAVSHTVSAFGDIQVIAGGVTALVILTMQSISLWRAFKTGKAVKSNAEKLDKAKIAIGVLQHSVDSDVKRELDRIRATVAHIQESTDHLEALMGRRKMQTADHPGRRANDVRRTPPIVVPLVEPPRADGVSGWPIS